MSSPSKAKGTRFETYICRYLKENWSDDIERLTLSGAKDRGDLANFRVGNGRHLIAWELKDRTHMALSSWVGETQEEADNYGAVAGVVCHKRKGKGAPADQYVTMTLSDFLTILYATGGA